MDWLLAHLVVALVALVGIGGATRVMQAGLACPDWPLCYGSLLPGRQMNLQVFLEWFHRLDAFLVGIALLVLASFSLLRRALLPRWLPWAAGVALLLVSVQAGLGALTVLGLLESSTVTAHLVTALLLVLLVSAMHQALLRSSTGCLPSAGVALPLWWTLLLAFSSLVLLGQCALGGAMASRWASSLCLQAGEGCRWLLTHRLGAWPALAALLLPAVLAHLLPGIPPVLRRFSLGPALLVPLQVALGVFTLRLQLQQPLVTVAHQLMAALLVALLGALWGITLSARSPAQDGSYSSSLEMAHG
ncbi:MAG: COX15/CtaA family protein [Cyanobacteria bacterium]|nr:COX15/CtaA family protein [Cyanobacteriota bacterium]